MNSLKNNLMRSPVPKSPESRANIFQRSPEFGKLSATKPIETTQPANCANMYNTSLRFDNFPVNHNAKLIAQLKFAPDTPEYMNITAIAEKLAVSETDKLP